MKGHSRWVRWTYCRHGEHLHCELRAQQGGCELRAWSDDGHSRLHRHYASAVEGVREHLAFEHFWIHDGWQLDDVNRPV